MAAARVGKPTGTISWSDGSPFNGYAVIGLVVPTASAVAWPAVNTEPGSPRQRLPLWAAIPIANGIFNSGVGIFYNSDINPPNTKYAIYYYDTALKEVGAPAGSGDFFTVSASSFAPPTYTLTVPTAGTAVPVPG